MATTGPFEFGVWSERGQGARSDVSSLVSGVLSGESDRSLALAYPEAYVRLSRGVQDLRAAIQTRPADSSFVPRSWQQGVISQVLGDADDRHILWVRDSLGGQGKSRLTRYLCLEKGAMSLSGRLADMMYAFSQAPAPIVIFDISRAQAEHSDHLYTMAEHLKNGQFFSTKYNSRCVFFTPPHVLFFANTMYDQCKWSADRVKLIDLDPPRGPNMGVPQM